MPLPSTIQTQMDTFNGKAPAVDDNYMIDDISFKFNVAAKTIAYTCKVKESGTFFTTEGQTAATIFTLPAVASSSGVVYWFANGEEFAMTITAPAATLVCGGNAAATSVGFQTANNMTGAALMLICNGTKWFAVPMRPQGDAIITVA